MMFNNVKAAIFDLDGTLIDSMWIWSKIDYDYLEKRGIDLPNDLKDQIAHLSFDETARYFKNRFNLPDTLDEIKQEWNDMALDEYTQNISLKEGACEFLQLLKLRGIKIALATSNTKTLLDVVLRRNGILHLFDVISTTDEVKRGKNFPDVYLLTAEKLGVPPETCIVFEDILPAIIGAKAAGMMVVGVHDLASDHQKDDICKIADRFISKYTELTTVV
jgi:HAD superfamily hydrolase (TIGR01509 family)